MGEKEKKKKKKKKEGLRHPCDSGCHRAEGPFSAVKEQSLTHKLSLFFFCF